MNNDRDSEDLDMIKTHLAKLNIFGFKNLLNSGTIVLPAGILCTGACFRVGRH